MGGSPIGGPFSFLDLPRAAIEIRIFSREPFSKFRNFRILFQRLYCAEPHQFHPREDFVDFTVADGVN